MNIFKEDNHINIRFLGLKIKFKNPFVNQLEDCCSIHNLKELQKKRIKFPHPIGIVIAKDAQIDEDCVIFQNVTIGKKNGLTKQGAPKIGKKVTIYANSVIVGDIKIGNFVVVGANSFVDFDIPDNTVVAGNPAKIIGRMDG